MSEDEVVHSWDVVASTQKMQHSDLSFVRFAHVETWLTLAPQPVSPLSRIVAHFGFGVLLLPALVWPLDPFRRYRFGLWNGPDFLIAFLLLFQLRHCW